MILSGRSMICGDWMEGDEQRGEVWHMNWPGADISGRGFRAGSGGDLMGPPSKTNSR